MIRKFISYCLKEGNSDAKDFVRCFIHEDILQGAKKTAESVWTTKSSAVSKHF